MPPLMHMACRILPRIVKRRPEAFKARRISLGRYPVVALPVGIRG